MDEVLTPLKTSQHLPKAIQVYRVSHRVDPTEGEFEVP